MNTEVCFQTPSLLTGRVGEPVLIFFCLILWRVGRRLGFCRLSSTSIRSISREFYISSFMWVLQVVFTQSLSNRSHHVIADGCQS